MTEEDRLTDKDLIWHPGTGVISAAQLMAMHTRHANAIRPIHSGTVLGYEHLMADADRGALLAELNRAMEEAARLERKNANLREALINAHEAGASLGQDVECLERERDGFRNMMNSAVSAGVTIDGERLDALREVERLRAIVAAARKALFEDAASSHEHRYRAIARALEREECPDEYCAGWKDSGTCPAGLRHR